MLKLEPKYETCSILLEWETENNEREKKKDQRIEFDEIEIGVKE